MLHGYGHDGHLHGRGDDHGYDDCLHGHEYDGDLHHDRGDAHAPAGRRLHSPLLPHGSSLSYASR